MIHLFVLLVVDSITLFALFIILVRSLWSLGSNTTTIEGWEIERHKALLRRARVLGGYLDGPDGIKVKIKRQEFPYDVGIWRNLKQGMGGSSNVSLIRRKSYCLKLTHRAIKILSWFWPFAATPSNISGIEFEVNEFEGKYNYAPSLRGPDANPSRSFILLATA